MLLHLLQQRLQLPAADAQRDAGDQDVDDGEVQQALVVVHCNVAKDQCGQWGTPLNCLTVSLASVQDLIALKQSVGRPIDLADIEHLKRLQTP
jgi:hypothetical protein